MDIICDKSKLLDGINIALKAVSGKTTMPILECMVIEVKEGKIKLIANNLEIGVETVIEGEIKQEGAVAVNAKFFFEVVRKLSSDDVRISSNEEGLNIKSGKGNFDIALNSVEEFPFLPQIHRERKISVSQFCLKEMIRQTIFSISDNENAKIMTGELFEIHGSEFRLVSLDGHRISIRKTRLDGEYGDVKAVIPGNTLGEISKILSGNTEDEVGIFFTDSHVLFEFEDTIVLSRLIEGEYYDIDRMLSGDYETQITLNRREMLLNLDQSLSYISEAEKKPVIIDIGDGRINFGINSSSKGGRMDSYIDDFSKEGKDMLIGFNPRFLIDALRAIDDEEVTIYMINPKAPCFIKDRDESYIYLILPVNIG